MDAACAKALEQIEEKDYVDRLRQDGMRNFIKCGIACFKKDCKVVVGKYRDGGTFGRGAFYGKIRES